MCGLVGVVGRDLDDSDIKMFRNLLVLDTARGEHSTGVAVVNGDNTVKVIKGVGDPFDSVFQDVEFWRALSKKKSVRILMGHNRFATVGKVSKDNAHPFEMGAVVGAHNGTLRTVHRLDDGHKFDVDSKALLNHINNHGIKDTSKDVDGAYAITWFDKNNKTFNIARNHERPMHFAVKNNKLYYASEPWMLEYAAKMSKVADIKPIKLEALRHISFDMSKSNFMGSSEIQKLDHYYINQSNRRFLPTNNRGGYRHGYPDTDKIDKRKYIGTTVLFYLSGDTGSDSSSNTGYFRGYICGYPEVKLRVYAMPYSKEYGMFKDNPYGKYRGTVRKVKKDGGQEYLLIRPTSIESVPKQGVNRYDHNQEVKGLLESSEVFLPVFNGVLVRKHEFLRLTTSGCAGCGDSILPGEADEITWASKDVCFCKSCKDNGILEKYEANEL